MAWSGLPRGVRGERGWRVSGRRLYWCGDDVFRACVLRLAMPQLGLRVLVPRGVTERGFARREGAGFSLGRVSRYLSSRGCSHLESIDREYGVKGSGDIDFAAEKDALLYAAEVKTRLIISRYTRIGVAREMLRYHLASPLEALAAWKRLEKTGVVKPGYDNPASIAELARLAVAAYMALEPRQLVIGLATVSYAKPVLRDAIGYVESTAGYLENCGLPVAGYAVLVVAPKEFTQDMLPSKILIKCYGDSCGKLSIPGNGAWTRIDWDKCPHALGCRECKYQRLCHAGKALYQELP